MHTKKHMIDILTENQKAYVSDLRKLLGYEATVEYNKPGQLLVFTDIVENKTRIVHYLNSKNAFYEITLYNLDFPEEE